MNSPLSRDSITVNMVVTMTDADKLSALIQKAYKDNWRKDYEGLELYDYDPEDGYVTLKYWQDYGNEQISITEDIQLRDLIFDHDFVRALIGNGPNCAYCGVPPHNMHPSPCVEGNNIWPYLWEYHLKEAVISDNPIEYLYKAVFND